MSQDFTPDSVELKIIAELLEALGSSLDIQLVLQRAYPLLVKLVPADYGALGVSSTGRPEDYAWTVANMPSSFFDAYPEMAPHDFVRASVAKKLNVVLRDDEMVSRAELESNMLYRRAREIGAPIEQVMAVMLHVDDRWQSGLSLYRDKQRPFSDRARAVLQHVTPTMRNAVRNCHMFGAAVEWGKALEAVLDDRDAAIVLVAPPSTEIERSDKAEQILARWFPGEWSGHQLPARIVLALAQATRCSLALGAPEKWTLRKGDVTLQITFVPLTGSSSKASWLLKLQEVPDALPIPRVWKIRCTPREQEVISAVANGWDNQSIADALGCAKATVTRHLSNIFDKLGVESRTALLARRMELLAE